MTFPGVPLFRAYSVKLRVLLIPFIVICELYPFLTDEVGAGPHRMRLTTYLIIEGGLPPWDTVFQIFILVRIVDFI